MRQLQQSERHARACRMLGYALTLEDDPDIWGGLSVVLRVRLTGFERACILVATIGSMTEDDVCFVLESLQQRRISMPLPPLLDARDEASWWAGFAGLEERKAVLVATFLSLPPRDRDTFLASASRRTAA